MDVREKSVETSEIFSCNAQELPRGQHDNWGQQQKY